MNDVHKTIIIAVADALCTGNFRLSCHSCDKITAPPIPKNEPVIPEINDLIPILVQLFMSNLGLRLLKS